MKIEGGCHCGFITYIGEADPEKTAICHCTDCQKLTGSAYRVTVPATDASLRLVAGQPSVYVKVGDSGARRAQVFCGHCGSPLYTYDADWPRVFGLRVGCIDERAALVPTKRVWCRSALAWSESLAGMPTHERE